MAHKVTRDILESYLNCQYKAYLKLQGEHGIKSDYEGLLIACRKEVKRTAIGKILARHTPDDVARDIYLTTAALRVGPAIVLDTTLEDDLLSLTFDGLKRVDGPSKLGDFHYVPMVFHEGPRVRHRQKLLLEVYGLLLSRLQGGQPDKGIVWYGQACKTMTVRLNQELRRTERSFRQVKDAATGGSPPRLILNKHCQICEFRQRCDQQAVQEDSLSLLRGMAEKEINRYAKKGIFTVTQVAHTFRPRRRGKRSPPKHNHRYHALQALAIRDKRVYVLGTPQLPDAPVHVYLDIGCGGGRTVERLAGIATDGKVVGIDYSPDAVVVARKKNRVLINEGRVEIFQEAVSSMRFSDGAFGLITAFESHYFWPDFRNDLKEVHRVTKENGQLLIVGAVYKNKKYDRRNQRIVDAVGMTYLSIEEFREVLEGVGYSEFDALEEKNKGWFAVKCKKQEGGTA